ncbi:MAG: cytochrome D ubiquinol oxidase subunit I, partial [Alphaproteobacteria bacterium]|nr:cytochrome D ubiquinol oxidase subunit I [Alphaproteobacteria bacterium]
MKRLRAILRNRRCVSAEPPAREAVDMPVNLDPEDWDEFRVESHRALDMMLEHLRDLRQRPVWTAPSEEAQARFKRELPQEGREFSAVLEDFDRYIKPFATGNTHPMFMGWAQGAGTPAGMIA